MNNDIDGLEERITDQLVLLSDALARLKDEAQKHGRSGQILSETGSRLESLIQKIASVTDGIESAAAAVRQVDTRAVLSELKSVRSEVQASLTRESEASKEHRKDSIEALRTLAEKYDRIAAENGRRSEQAISEISQLSKRIDAADKQAVERSADIRNVLETAHATTRGVMEASAHGSNAANENHWKAAKNLIDENMEAVNQATESVVLNGLGELETLQEGRNKTNAEQLQKLHVIGLVIGSITLILALGAFGLLIFKG